jgi:Tat-targeted selenate reductase subunit YnfE
VWINPLDAGKRGIKNGDLVRVFNSRGELRIAAKVTPRPASRPWAREHGMTPVWTATASIVAPALIPDHPAAFTAGKGNPQHTNLVDIARVQDAAS